MKRPSFYQAIINTLDRAYAKMTLKILHRRIRKYHGDACQTTTPHPMEIKKSLNACISEIIEGDSGGAQRQAIINLTVGITPFNTQRHDGENQAAARREVNRENVKELSRYFKSGPGGGDLHPDIEEKLEHSAWEHIHTAIRHARQGNFSGAKMHVDIACSACHELAHYKTDEQYQAFLREVDLQIGKIRPANPGQATE